ncbi:MAG TPA: nitroreductase family protein [Candidatus Anoxymicrobiaceae bacterium]|jgi:nitroreductase
MEELKPSKTPTRDYQSFSATRWTVLETMYARRSHRKYKPMVLDDAVCRELGEVAGRACAARGAPADSLLPVTGADEVKALRSRAYRGISGVINIWLARAPLAAFLVLAVDHDDMKEDRPLILPRTVMAAEDAVLWLTEQGIGTCWLGGVNAREVAGAMGLTSEVAIPAVISAGEGALPAGPASYAGIAYRRMSRRRKQLGQIACAEKVGTPYVAPDLEGCRFEAAVEGVSGLLAAVSGEEQSPARAQAPMDLAVDACLEAARIAPSGSNAQPWIFVVVRDSDRIGRLAQLCGEAAGMASRPAAIVALGRPSNLQTRMLDRPFWMIDVPIAVSHITLLAASMGFAPALALDGIDEKGIGRLLEAPGDWRPVAVIGL